MKQMNKKGFTLIELLAVIVILGLLMAIAIPSVTRYITQSRKKTVVSTIGNYITAAINDINDMEYAFTGENTIYALPIECIALERGGSSPLGEWHQASNSYWAYVLVQCDVDNSKYIYGYTFKDSNGNGMYPTVQSKIDSKGNEIQRGLSLSRPTTGTVTNITGVSNWSGFDVDSDTNLVVLEAQSEGDFGNGKETCTLRQKAKNYEEAEQEKIEKTKDLVLRTKSDNEYFWNYNFPIKRVIVEDSINIPSDISDDHKWDISATQKGRVMAYITPNSSDNSMYDLYIQGDGGVYANSDSSVYFEDFFDCSYFDVSKLNTSKVTSMHSMFSSAGQNATTFEIVGLDKWDTSNVTDMSSMFQGAGMYARTWSIGDLSNWKTSKVINMSSMFYSAGMNATTWSVGDLSNWNTSSVTDMSFMFSSAGQNATTMWSIGDLSNWITSKVINMSSMFSSAGGKTIMWSIGDLSNWNTSSVTDMSSMFSSAGQNATTFEIVGLDKWDTSNVTNMSSMFSSAGLNSTTFKIVGLDKWDTSNVIDMSYMFSYTGRSATYLLDLSGWQVPLVIYRDFFNEAVDTKVIAPTFG